MGSYRRLAAGDFEQLTHWALRRQAPAVVGNQSAGQRLRSWPSAAQCCNEWRPSARN